MLLSNYTMSRNMRRFISISLPVLFMGAIFFLIIGFVNKDAKAIRGVSVVGINLYELNTQKAQELLEVKIENYKNSNMSLVTDTGIELKANTKNFGPTFDIKTTLENAYAVGKNKNYVLNKLYQARAFMFGVKVPIKIELDGTIFSHFVSNTLEPIHNPAKNASFIYDFDTQVFNFSPAQEGFVININELQNKILYRMNILSNEDIKLKQTIDKPLIENQGVPQALAQAQAIVENGPYIIKAKSDEWEIEYEDLINWIDFRPAKNDNEYILTAAISRARVQNYLTPFVAGLRSAPVNAEFKLEKDRVVAFNLATPGYELNIEESTNQIANAIESSQKQSSLVFVETSPQITQVTVDNLGINALLGRGESSFAGSPNSRKHNIALGASQYQGLLIKPGEEFSFNKSLGEVTATEGYLPELVIKNNQTVPEYGGGLCQVSTTLFRAAVYSGLEITKRSNHSYPVVYYGTPGFDATIYPPSPDLAFKNNTPGYILIQQKIEGSKLTFEIYGQNDGRQVEIVGPVTYDQKSDGSVKATLQQIVKNKDGNVLFEKTFYSNYKSPKLYPINRNPLE